MVHFKLIYFNARGRAEVIRYILAYVGHKYEDYRVSQNDWQLMKTKTVFGQLPVLEISDGTSTVQLGQSMAIVRFLGNHFKLNGINELEQVNLTIKLSVLILI